jgi:hypothetical protein
VRWPLVGFVLLTILVFRPTPFEVAHTVPEVDGTVGDALLYVWAIGHVSKTLFWHPSALFDGRMFHPAADTLAFSDHMIGQALLGLPIWNLTTSDPFGRNPVGSAVLEFNLISLASYALGATAAFVYVRALVGSSAAAATAAGIAFVFTPLRFRSSHYIQTLVTFFVPLALLAWLRFVERPSRRPWVWWVVFWIAHSLMGMYATVYFAVVMGVLGAWALVAAPARSDRRLWIGTVLAPVASLIVLAPTLWPYIRTRATLGLERSNGYDTIVAMLLPAEGTSGDRLLGFVHPHQFGPGLVVWLLAGIGLVVGRRRRTDGGLPARFLWEVHALGLATLLALMLLPLTWTQRLPGFDLLRTTHRPFFLALLFIAYFVAEGVTWLEARMPSPRARRAFAAIVVLMVALDMGTAPRTRRPIAVAEDLPQIYREVRDLPDAVVYDDMGKVEGRAIALYYSLYHGKRLAGGYSGFAGPWGEYTMARLQLFPRDEATDLLRDLGVRHVVKHFQSATAAEDFRRGVESPAIHVETQLTTALLIRLGEPPPSLPTAPVAVLPREGWSIRASDGVRRLESLRDGSAETTAIARVDSNPSPWIVVEVGEVTSLSGVRVTPSSAGDSTIYLARVELSLDGSSWEMPRTWFEPDDRRALLEHPRAVRYFDARFVPTRARYVRLINPRARFRMGRWEIGELDLLGGAGAVAGARGVDGDPRESTAQ